MNAARSDAGLVSIPTSGLPGSWRSFTESITQEEHSGFAAANFDGYRKDRLASMGAFQLDKAGRRLASLRCAVGFSARAHAVTAKGSRSDVPWLVTLTYRPGDAWEARHVSDALTEMRKWCKEKAVPFRYVWIAEIQDGKRREDGVGRNVIHYHVAVWLPVGTNCPQFDRRGWWPHGMSNTVKAKHASAYLMHYLKKDKELGAMPKGARAYGVGGLDKHLRRARRWCRLPSFVRANSSTLDDWRPARGGGWTDPCGEIWPSEFRRERVAGVDVLVRVHTHPRAIEAAGCFSWLTDRSVALQLSH